MFFIKGATIVDGTGAEPYEADLIVKNDRISAIGDFGARKIGNVPTINAAGAYLTPGFIDIHSTSDHYLSLFTNPTQDDFLLQGITSTIGGHCGASLAPLLYGSLESIRKWADTSAINVDWHTLRELWDVLRRRPVGINFGTLVGHSTIRRGILGEASRDLTTGELAVMRRLIRESLEAGAFGISTGLGYTHARMTPFLELKEIARIAADAGALYATHLRDEYAGVAAALRETIALTRETGVTAIVSHFRPRLEHESRYREAMNTVFTETEQYPLFFETYPSDMALVPLYTLLPQWAREGNLEAMTGRLFDHHFSERIVSELSEINPDLLYVLSAPNAEYVEGKSLSAIMRDHGFPKKKALFELMKLTKLRSVVWYHNADLDWILQMLTSPRVLVGSTRPSIRREFRGRLPEALFTMFPRFIEIMTSTRLRTLPEAIAQITSRPAKLLGLKGRGEIKEGNVADLVLLRHNRVSDVWVNGAHAVEQGTVRDGTQGKLLLKT